MSTMGGGRKTKLQIYSGMVGAEKGKDIDTHDTGQEQGGKPKHVYSRGLTAVGAMPRVLLSIWMNCTPCIVQIIRGH